MKGEVLQLDGHVLGAEEHLLRNLQVGGGEAQNRLHPGGDHLVDHRLGTASWNRHDDHLNTVPSQKGLKVLDVGDDNPLMVRADLPLVVVEGQFYMETLFLKLLVDDEGGADIPHPNNGNIPGAIYPQDFSDLVFQLPHRITQSPGTEASEKGEVFPDLCRSQLLPFPQLFGANRLVSTLLQVREAAVVEGETMDG